MTKRQGFCISLDHPRGRLRWFVLLPLLLLLAWIFLPVTRGDFVADDYVFLATARMVDAPLAAFWQSHFYEPNYFRPVGVLSWWVAMRLFGLDYASHSFINFFLHFANAGLLFWLLRALALRANPVAAGVALFALGPFALATILWPSNRFDLLAVGFLLVQAIAMVRALQGNALAFAFAMLAALGACWSKESAYAISTMMCLVALAAGGVSWRLRGMLFALLGATIGGAFFWRHRIVTDAYAIASADPVGQVVDGVRAMVLSLPKLTGLIIGESMLPWLGWGLFGAVLSSLVWARRDVGASGVSRWKLFGALLVALAAFVIQAPAAKLFAPMLDGGAFGTVTFARFYYVPWATVSVILALILARGQLGAIASLGVMGLMIVVGLAARPLAESYTEWTRQEIRPIAVGATRLVDAASDAPCVYVLLGTQNKHPFFRMFSDVTVKARTATSDKTWRCHIMTESTPWLFAFPAGVTPRPLPLREITDAAGNAKPDSFWGGIRYRYRLPSVDLAVLPGARYFDWRGGQFVDMTEDVRSGARTVVSQEW